MVNRWNDGRYVRYVYILLSNDLLHVSRLFIIKYREINNAILSQSHLCDEYRNDNTNYMVEQFPI